MGEFILRIIVTMFSFMGLFAGIVLTIIGYSASKFITPILSKNSVETTANIISIDKNYNEYDGDGYEKNHQVFVEYEVDGKIYQSELNAYSSEFEVGKQVDILYNENNVTEIVYANIEDVANIFNAVKSGGVCLILFCGLILIRMSINSKKKKRIQNDIIDTYDEPMYDNGQFYTSKNNESIKSENNPIDLNSDSSNDGAIKYK